MTPPLSTPRTYAFFNVYGLNFDNGLLMERQALVSRNHLFVSQPVPRRRIRLHLSVVITIASIIVLALFFAVFLISKANVEITTSTLRMESGFSSNYRQVAVDVSLYNPGWSRRLTVWVEITSQLTQVSYSKGQYVNIGFRASKDVTIDFTLDKTIDYAEFTHQAWVTYIEQD
jgi:hypothetical protein